MTREQYIRWRTNNNLIAIVYDFYYNHCKQQSKVPIDLELFAQVFPLYRNAQVVVDETLRYYDKVLDIRYLENQGKIIMVL